MKQSILAMVLVLNLFSAQVTLAQAPATSAIDARPHLLLVRVYVTDLDRSERFYRAAFGFNAAIPFGPDNRMFGAPSATSPTIVLAKVDKPRGNGSFALAVSDTATVMNAVEAAGGAIEKQVQQAHGLPIGFVTDPDGTVIEVIQLSKAP
jgi:catechol 2,3-dioxygenase-like lactoylglutathione lyase family enzyme